MESLAYISGIFFFMCYLPQVYKTWKTGEVRDVSLLMWVLYLGGYLTGALYAISIHKIALLVSYGSGLVINIVYLILYSQCNKKIYIRRPQ